MKINPNIVSVTEGLALIENQTTACVIRITVAPDDREDGYEFMYLSYKQADDLLNGLIKMTTK